jgi:hypothetical protein
MKKQPLTEEVFSSCKDCGEPLLSEKAQRRGECTGRMACLDRKEQARKLRELEAMKAHAFQRDRLMARAVAEGQSCVVNGVPYTVISDEGSPLESRVMVPNTLGVAEGGKVVAIAKPSLSIEYEGIDPRAALPPRPPWEGDSDSLKNWRPDEAGQAVGQALAGCVLPVPRIPSQDGYTAPANHVTDLRLQWSGMVKDGSGVHAVPSVAVVSAERKES